VPESDIAQIKSGIPVDVTIKSLGATVKGEVTEVSTSAKNTGGQYLVKAVLDKTDAKILSGMFATVQFPIEAKTKNSLVLVPKSAIVERGQLKGVYTVSSQNTAILRWVTVGKNFGDEVQILSGLDIDEPYILSADGRLFNGAKVTIQ
jgi:multidrug efflux pump subunit AcrA (membrane-fusion protein)